MASFLLTLFIVVLVISSAFAMINSYMWSDRARIEKNRAIEWHQLFNDLVIAVNGKFVKGIEQDYTYIMGAPILISNIKSLIKEQWETYNKLLQSYEELVKHNEVQEQTLATCQKSLLAAMAELKDAHANLATAEDLRVNLFEQIDTLKATAERHQKNIEINRVNYGIERDKVKALAETNTALGHELAELKESHEYLRTERMKLSEIIADRENQLSALTMENKSTTDRCAQMLSILTNGRSDNPNMPLAAIRGLAEAEWSDQYKRGYAEGAKLRVMSDECLSTALEETRKTVVEVRKELEALAKERDQAVKDLANATARLTTIAVMATAKEAHDGDSYNPLRSVPNTVWGPPLSMPCGTMPGSDNGPAVGGPCGPGTVVRPFAPVEPSRTGGTMGTTGSQ